MQVRHPVRAMANVVFRRAPVEAQLIVTRRCNLSCGYCTEYDDHSEMIPLETLKRRIDALHRLNVVNICLLGGEPLMHPDLPAIVAYANRRAQVSITSNGFLIGRQLILELNRAGLANMQVSVDAVQVSRSGYIQKCLKTIRPKLRLLQELAAFDFHINLVLCEQTKNEFADTLQELRDLGLRVSLDLLHDASGAVAIGGPEYVGLWKQFFREAGPFFRLEEDYGAALLGERRPTWHCRAGSRLLYVDEFGDVQLCSAQRRRPGKPVLQYTPEDLCEQAGTHKPCERGCALICSYRASAIDNQPLLAAIELVRMLVRTNRPRAMRQVGGMAGAGGDAQRAQPAAAESG